MTPGRGMDFHAAMRALDDSRMSVNYTALPLEEVFEDLRDKLGINMVVYWPSLSQAGVDRDLPVTLTLADVSGLTVLRHTLHQINAARNSDIDWQLDQAGVLEVDRRQRLEEQLYIRVYRASELVAPNYSNQSYSQGSMQGGQMGLGGATNMGGGGYRPAPQYQPGSRGYSSGYDGSYGGYGGGYGGGYMPYFGSAAYQRQEYVPYSPAGMGLVTGLEAVVAPGVGMYQPRRGTMGVTYSRPGFLFQVNQ